MTSASAQGGTVGIRLVDVPVASADDPRAQIYIVDHVNPGDRVVRRVQVVNNTDGTLPVRLYAGAAEVRNDAFTTLGPDASNELVDWVSLEPELVEIGAGRTAVSTVTIDIPATADDGERYGVVWAQPPAGGDEVAVVNRVGVRIYLSVGQPGEAVPEADFEIDSLVAERNPEGRPIVHARVVNTGDRALDLSGELELRDGPAGLSAGPFAAERGTTLAPGDDGPMEVLLDPDLPAGPWLARMIARSGTLEKAVEAEISFPDAAGDSAEPVEATEVPLHRDRGLLLPLALGLLVLALFLVLLVWFLAKRRREDEDEDAEDASTDQPVGTTS